MIIYCRDQNGYLLLSSMNKDCYNQENLAQAFKTNTKEKELVIFDLSCSEYGYDSNRLADELIDFGIPQTISVIYLIASDPIKVALPKSWGAKDSINISATKLAERFYEAHPEQAISVHTLKSILETRKIKVESALWREKGKFLVKSAQGETLLNGEALTFEQILTEMKKFPAIQSVHY